MGKVSWTTLPWGWGEQGARHPAPSQPLFAGCRPGTHPGMPGSAPQLCRETRREQKAADKEQSLLQLNGREGFVERNDCHTAQEERRGWGAVEKGSLALLHRETLSALITIKTQTPNAPTASTTPHSHAGPCPNTGQWDPYL